MDPRLLRYYNQELQHVREMGAEFAAEFPKIAGRLGMEGMEVADPYVERLLEGFAFLTARLQLRMDAEFPLFTQRLLDILYPQFLAPVPAMLIAQVRPRLGDDALASGVTLPRGTRLRARAAHSPTPCEFTTGSALTLWPVAVTGVEYFTHAGELPVPPAWRRAAGGVRIRLRCAPGMDFARVGWHDIRLSCTSSDSVGFRLHELITGHAMGVLVRRSAKGAAEALPARIEPLGFEDEEALLPVTQRGFAGYRLLQEYFALPQKFLSFELRGCGAALQRLGGNEADLIVLLDRGDPSLGQSVAADALALHCVPAINLFERRCDRIHVSPRSHDFHVVADRTRPLDYEIHQVLDVTGFGAGSTSERHFRPLYGAFQGEERLQPAYYTVQREPRMLSSTQKREGPRSSYVGSEVFLSIVDAAQAPYSDDLRQLAVRALCSNRDLPLQIPTVQGTRELQLDVAAPVASVHALREPSRPQPALRDGQAAWQLINQFALHHLSLSDTNATEGAAALRDMLRLYLPPGDAAATRQVEGLRSVRSTPTVRRLPMAGPIAFGRGVQIEVDVDEHAFEGGSAYLLGTLLERWFARHVALNAFTVTRIRSLAQGVILEGRPRCGNRPIL
ncbi:type VI secretion system baseplate subunit TssF [Ramlibacter sp. AW1]|uniref:Type VI secretion system baseplate subunit TssF n=1 Tax=Ramlibacter aurantiacus TaxID=2801330 RepID=A0A937D3S1_9BURK|nr:type VI secretion system baseplate subunit TssF [Ramlibacter aurantiacus]MBL0419617.1 type VI secretion system baseplate subunit TssF [Ramlibacter aurantiacus]